METNNKAMLRYIRKHTKKSAKSTVTKLEATIAEIVKRFNTIPNCCCGKAAAPNRYYIQYDTHGFSGGDWEDGTADSYFNSFKGNTVTEVLCRLITPKTILSMIMGNLPLPKQLSVLLNHTTEQHSDYYGNSTHYDKYELDIGMFIFVAADLGFSLQKTTYTTEQLTEELAALRAALT